MLALLVGLAQDLAPTEPTPAWLDSLGPFIAFGGLALLVIGGLTRALAAALKENRATTDRVFAVVEATGPVLQQVKDELERSTRQLETTTRALERSRERER